MVQANILVRANVPTKKGYVYAINKDYESWKPLVQARRLVQARTISSTLASTKTSTLASTYKNKKQYIQKQYTASSNDSADSHMEELTYESVDIPKKEPNRSKVYKPIVLFYMGLLGKTGNALRFYPAMKEIYGLYFKEFPTDTPEQAAEEIKKRIEVAHWHYSQTNIKDWGLGKVAENWQKIIKEWYPEKKKHL